MARCSLAHSSLWLCGAHTKFENHCIVYSFTDNTDLTFETDILKASPNCLVYVLTPSTSIISPNLHIIVHAWNPTATLTSVAISLGHTKVSLVKVAITDSMKIIKGFMAETSRPSIDQVRL